MIIDFTKNEKYHHVTLESIVYQVSTVLREVFMTYVCDTLVNQLNWLEHMPVPEAKIGYFVNPFCYLNNYIEDAFHEHIDRIDVVYPRCKAFRVPKAFIIKLLYTKRYAQIYGEVADDVRACIPNAPYTQACVMCWFLSMVMNHLTCRTDKNADRYIEQSRLTESLISQYCTQIVQMNADFLFRSYPNDTFGSDDFLIQLLVAIDENVIHNSYIACGDPWAYYYDEGLPESYDYYLEDNEIWEGKGAVTYPATT